MSISSIMPKIVSTLGSTSSLAPIMAKDAVDSASVTYYSYKAGGKVEGLDRAADEFGTQAIWIGGIPFFKKLIDKTAYKLAKINPGVDIRIISDKEYANWAVKNANGLMGQKSKGKFASALQEFSQKFIGQKPAQTVKSAIEKSLENIPKTKSLYLTKVIAATALTLISYFALTKTRQKLTKERIEHDIFDDKKPQLSKEQQKANQEFLAKETNKNIAFNSVFKPFVSHQPSFKGLKDVGKSVVDGVLFNPVHNMKLIDAGITSERLAQSRNKTELAEHAIKEGMFLFFIYGLGNVLAKGINKASEKFLKKPIDLDIQVLMSDELKKALPTNKIVDDIKKMPLKEAKLTEFLDFIVKNPDNIVVQAAKKANVVSTVGKTDVVDTSKFISRASFEEVAENLKKMEGHFKLSSEPIEKFLKKTKGLKVAAVLSNLVACCFVLGYIVPNAVYKYREMKTGTKKFHVAEDIKKAEGAKA